MRKSSIAVVVIVLAALAIAIGWRHSSIFRDNPRITPLAAGNGDWEYESLEDWGKKNKHAIEKFHQLRVDNNWQLIGLHSGTLQAWTSDLQTPVRMRCPDEPGYQEAFAASHDGRYVAYLNRKSRLSVFNRRAHTTETVTPPGQRIKSGYWDISSSHSKQLFLYVTTSITPREDQLHLYNAAAKRDAILVRKPHIEAPAFSPSDKRISFVGEGMTLCVFDIEDGSVSSICKLDEVDFLEKGYDWVDDERIVAKQKKGRIALFAAGGARLKELFIGRKPRCLKGDMVVFEKDRRWYIGFLDGNTKKKSFDADLSIGSYRQGISRIVAVSPCRGYFLLYREIDFTRSRPIPPRFSWPEALVLDTDLSKCGASFFELLFRCEWVSRIRTQR